MQSALEFEYLPPTLEAATAPNTLTCCWQHPPLSEPFYTRNNVVFISCFNNNFPVLSTGREQFILVGEAEMRRDWAGAGRATAGRGCWAGVGNTGSLWVAAAYIITCFALTTVFCRIKEFIICSYRA